MALKVVESVDINGFDNALDDSLNELEAQGMGDINDPTPVFILMGKNGKIIDGSFGVDVRIFTGGTFEEVVNNLQEQLKTKA